MRFRLMGLTSWVTVGVAVIALLIGALAFPDWPTVQVVISRISKVGDAAIALWVLVAVYVWGTAIPRAIESVRQQWWNLSKALDVSCPSSSIRNIGDYFTFDVSLSNQSRYRVNIAAVRLLIEMSEHTAILPHIGHDTYGSHGEVPGSERALPLALTIEAFSLPVSGVLRFRYPQHTDPLKEEVNFSWNLVIPEEEKSGFSYVNTIFRGLYEHF